MIAIGTPCYDNRVHVPYMDSLIDTYLSIPGITILMSTHEALLPRARNKIFQLAYANPEVEQLIWIDSDESWTRMDILQLIADEHDFVSGLVRQKRDDTVHCVWDYDKATHTARACGTGFCKMRRPVLEALWQASSPYKDIDGPDEVRTVFEVTYPNGLLMSEDYSACHKWSGKIFIREDIRPVHYGEKAYV